MSLFIDQYCTVALTDIRSQAGSATLTGQGAVDGWMSEACKSSVHSTLS